MSDNSEYQQLVNEKASVSSQIRNTEYVCQSLEDRIARLRVAKAKMDALYGDFKTERDQLKGLFKSDTEWKGQRYDEYVDEGEEMVRAADTYLRNLDSARDDIHWALTNLENESYRQQGILGHLRAAWNDLTCRIENFFN